MTCKHGFLLCPKGCAGEETTTDEVDALRARVEALEAACREALDRLTGLCCDCDKCEGLLEPGEYSPHACAVGASAELRKALEVKP